MIKLKLGLPQNRRGDTIVEVLISVTILALVVATAFSLTNKSFHSGTDAGERQQALSYANQQVELLKAAVAKMTQPSDWTRYKVTGYCIAGAGQTPVNSTDPSCTKGGLYKMTIDYAPADSSAPAVFKVTASWANSSGSNSDQVLIYYRPNGVGG